MDDGRWKGGVYVVQSLWMCKAMLPRDAVTAMISLIDWSLMSLNRPPGARVAVGLPRGPCFAIFPAPFRGKRLGTFQ